MDFFTRVFAAVLLLLAVQGCPDPPTRPCSMTLTRLTDLYREDLRAEMDRDSVVCVDLQAYSRETLPYRDTNLSFSVLITGNNSTISCDSSSPRLQDSNYTHFPLYFRGGSVVSITGLNFERCERPLQFHMVQTVSISSSTFQDFCCGGTVEISNSPNVCIQDSHFTNSISYGLSRNRFSGNAGGVAIGYSEPGPLLRPYTPNVLITGCTFLNNTANATEENKLTVLAVLSMRVYNQRGGGVAMYFGAENYNALIRIENCQFTDNTAQDSGGGIYMFLDGPGSAHNISIWDTNFTGNSAQDGGGLEITHSNPDSPQNPNFVEVIGCRFDRNWGKFGGGYKNIQLSDISNSNHLLVRNTTFDENKASVGAGIYLQSVVTVEKTTSLKRIVMEDCCFRYNNGKRGVMFVIGNVVTIRGNTVFHQSTGPALRILGTLAELHGDILFEENRHDPEGFSGALYLSSFAQIVLNAQTNITFINNNGSEGACIVVRGQLIAAAFTKQLYNPQCFLQYEDPTKEPRLWNVSITFRGNRANVGPAVLLSDKNICLWNSSTTPFFSDSLRNTWRFMDMRNNFINEVEEATDSDIQTGIFSLTLESDDEYLSAYPGETVAVRAIALDQFNQNTSAFIGIDTKVSLNETIPVSGITNFEPSIVQISPQNGTIQFKYRGSEDDINTTVVLNAFFTSDQEDTPEFLLHHDRCKPGHSLNNSECQCTEDTDIILCQDDGLLLADGLWGAPPGWCTELVTHPCPPGYCNCTGIAGTDIREGCQLLFKEPEMICIKERRRENQILCGRCNEGYGVGLLTNTCQEHYGPPHYYWLIPIYVIALIVALVVLVKLGIHLPTILRGFLFYVQIAPIAMAYFPQSFNLQLELLSCIGSTLALYVPYDFTFHREMTSLESYAIRYSAPIIALIVVPIAARVRQHRLKYWHGIWTIILLMYVMSVETSISLLFCPVLKCQADSNTISAWFFDGNVRCYHREHIPLAIVAMLCLLVQALLVIFITASIYYKTLRKKYIKFERLERICNTVTRGIKEEYKWWPIMELGCRFIFVIAVVLSSGVVVVPLIISILIFVLQSLIHPYESKVANYLESFLFLWLVCLLGLANTTALQDEIKSKLLDGKYGTGKDGSNRGPWWPNALLYIPVAVGFVVLVVHFVFLFRRLFLTHKDAIKRKLKMKTEQLPVGFTTSFSRKKSLLLSQGNHLSTHVTKSEVGLGDDELEDSDL